LRDTLAGVRSGASLGWGVLGLKAHGALPAEAPIWLGESYDHCKGRPDPAVSLALLLLAASEDGLNLLGAEQQEAAGAIDRRSGFRFTPGHAS
jgi:hypothetical protein